ncbi:hypothetical protein [Streptomyces sp. NPDC090021]|uniref:hypothetical protein n=1 Tax=Streptomyces sp. NPDC090021 TaxID=3365919 RepID=UPI0038200231
MVAGDTGDRDRNGQPTPLDHDNPDIVLGVDTHKDVHVAAVVSAAAGVFVESRSLPTTAEGYEH